MNENIDQLHERSRIDELNPNASTWQTVDSYLSADETPSITYDASVSVNITSSQKTKLIQSPLSSVTDGNYIENDGTSVISNSTKISMVPGEDATKILNGLAQQLDTPEKLATFIKDSIQYAPETKDYWQSAAETYLRGKGDCEDLAFLAQALLQAQGKQAIVTNINNSHAVCIWLEKTSTGYTAYSFDSSKGLGSGLGETAAIALEKIFQRFNASCSEGTLTALIKKDDTNKYLTRITIDSFTDTSVYQTQVQNAYITDLCFSGATPSDVLLSDPGLANQADTFMMYANRGYPSDWREIALIIRDMYRQLYPTNPLRSLYADIVLTYDPNNLEPFNNLLFNGTGRITPAPAPGDPEEPLEQPIGLNATYRDLLTNEDYETLKFFGEYGQWDFIYEFLQIKKNYYKDEAKHAAGQYKAAMNRAVFMLTELVNMNIDDLNTTLFRGTARATPLFTPSTAPTPLPYTYTPGDPIETVLNGMLENSKAELLNVNQFVEQHYQYLVLSQYYGLFSNDEKSQLQTLANINDVQGILTFLDNKARVLAQDSRDPNNSIPLRSEYGRQAIALRQLWDTMSASSAPLGILFSSSKTGYMTFNTSKWTRFSRNMTGSMTLLQMYAMLVQAKGESRNIIEQEMLADKQGEKVDGYQKMAIMDLLGQQAQYIGKFQKKYLTENINMINDYNQKYRDAMQKAINETFRPRSWWEQLTASGGGLIIALGAVLLGIAATALSGGAAIPIAIALMSGIMTTNMIKLTQERALDRSRRLASVEQDFSSVAQAQIGKERSTTSELNSEEQQYQDSLQRVKDGSDEDNLQLFLENALELAVDAVDPEEFIAITMNGFQVFAAGRALNLLLRARALSIMLQIFARMKKQKKGSRSTVHQELTGVSSYESSNTIDEALQRNADELLTTVQRKMTTIQQGVKAFNQLKRSQEEIKKQQLRYQLTILKNNMLTAVNVATAGIGGIWGVLSSTGTGFMNGTMNYEIEKRSEDTEKLYDPENIRTSSAFSFNKNPQDISATDALKQRLQTELAGEQDLPFRTVTGRLITQLGRTNNDTLAQGMTENRAIFDGTTAASIQNRIEQLGNLQGITYKVYRHNKNARSGIHKEMTQVGSAEMGNTAEMAEQSGKAMNKTAMQFQFEEIQQEINAKNAQVQKENNIETAKYGILLATASGFLGGVARGAAGTDTTLYGLSSLGQVAVAEDGLGGQLVQKYAIKDSDINIDPDSGKESGYEANRGNSLDTIVGENDASNYESLTYTDRFGRVVVDHDAMAAKLDRINRTINLNKVFATLQKANVDMREMIHAEMTSINHSQNYTSIAEDINRAATSHYFAQLQLLSNHLQALAQMESAKSQALIKFDRTLYKSLVVCAYSATGIAVGTASETAGTKMINCQSLVGAGIDTYYINEDLQNKELQNKMSSNQITDDVLNKRQGERAVNALQRMEDIETELQKQIIAMKSQVTDFGLTTFDHKALKYAETLLSQIETMRDLYLMIDSKVKNSRRILHGTLHGKGTTYEELAQKIQETNDQFIKGVQEELAATKRELSTQQNRMATTRRQATITMVNASITGVTAMATTFNSSQLNLSTIKEVSQSVERMKGLNDSLITLSQKDNWRTQAASGQTTFNNYNMSRFNATDRLAIETGSLETENALSESTFNVINGVQEQVAGNLQEALKLTSEKMARYAILNDIERILRAERLKDLSKELQIAEERWDDASQTIQAYLNSLKIDPTKRTEILTALQDGDWETARDGLTKLTQRNILLDEAEQQKLNSLVTEGDEAFTQYTTAKTNYTEGEIQLEKEILLVKNAYKKFDQHLETLQQLQKELVDIFRSQEGSSAFVEGIAAAFQRAHDGSVPEKLRSMKRLADQYQPLFEHPVKLTRSKELDDFISTHGKKYRYDDKQGTLVVRGDVTSAESAQLRTIYPNITDQQSITAFETQSHSPFDRLINAFERNDFSDLTLTELLTAYNLLPQETKAELITLGTEHTELFTLLHQQTIKTAELAKAARPLALFYAEFSGQTAPLLIENKKHMAYHDGQSPALKYFLFAAKTYQEFYMSPLVNSIKYPYQANQYSTRITMNAARIKELQNSTQDLTPEEQQELSELEQENKEHTDNLHKLYIAMTRIQDISKSTVAFEEEPDISKAQEKLLAERVENNIQVLNALNIHELRPSGIVEEALRRKMTRADRLKKAVTEATKARTQAQNDHEQLRRTLNDITDPIPLGALPCSDSLKRYLQTRPGVGTEISAENQDIVLAYTEGKLINAEKQLLKAEEELGREQEIVDWDAIIKVRQEVLAQEKKYQQCADAYIELLRAPITDNERILAAWNSYQEAKDKLNSTLSRSMKFFDKWRSIKKDNTLEQILDSDTFTYARAVK